jgi:hypothetical protein
MTSSSSPVFAATFDSPPLSPDLLHSSPDRSALHDLELDPFFGLASASEELPERAPELYFHSDSHSDSEDGEMLILSMLPSSHPDPQTALDYCVALPRFRQVPLMLNKCVECRNGTLMPSVRTCPAFLAQTATANIDRSICRRIDALNTTLADDRRALFNFQSRVSRMSLPELRPEPSPEASTLQLLHLAESIRDALVREADLIAHRRAHSANLAILTLRESLTCIRQWFAAAPYNPALSCERIPCEEVLLAATAVANDVLHRTQHFLLPHFFQLDFAPLHSSKGFAIVQTIQ